MISTQRDSQGGKMLTLKKLVKKLLDKAERDEKTAKILVFLLLLWIAGFSLLIGYTLARLK